MMVLIPTLLISLELSAPDAVARLTHPTCWEGIRNVLLLGPGLISSIRVVVLNRSILLPWPILDLLQQAFLSTPRLIRLRQIVIGRCFCQPRIQPAQLVIMTTSVLCLHLQRLGLNSGTQQLSLPINKI